MPLRSNYNDVPSNRQITTFHLIVTVNPRLEVICEFVRNQLELVFFLIDDFDQHEGEVTWLKMLVSRLSFLIVSNPEALLLTCYRENLLFAVDFLREIELKEPRLLS